MSDDVVKIHWKQALIAFVVGCFLGMAGLRTVATFTDVFDGAIERQQQEMCGSAISELMLNNARANVKIEKRVSALEATLKAHGIDIPEVE